MAKRTSGASARLLNPECRSTVEVVIPAGTSFDEVLKRPELLVDIFSKFRPSGCQVCLSGRDFLIREMFEEVVNVEFGG